jgi:hypothetical protein
MICIDGVYMIAILTELNASADWIYLIIKMSFFWGSFTGMLLGFYFAEKNVPFPISYIRPSDGSFGAIELDLRIINTIISDAKSTVGYSAADGSTPSSPP